MIVALSVVVGMMMILTWVAEQTAPYWRHDWTMAAMVGGTAGGLLGGLIAWVGGKGMIGSMELMTASMVGMIGGILSGWRFYG